MLYVSMKKLLIDSLKSQWSKYGIVNTLKSTVNTNRRFIKVRWYIETIHIMQLVCIANRRRSIFSTRSNKLSIYLHTWKLHLSYTVASWPCNTIPMGAKLHSTVKILLAIWTAKLLQKSTTVAVLNKQLWITFQ